MIIFGTRGVTYSSGSGDFFCPNCGSASSYSQKRVRRFFTLYFIPLIPLDLHGEYIECQRCRGKYNMEVLDYDPGAASVDLKTAFQEAVTRVMVEVMLADGRIHETEIQVFRRLYLQMTGLAISEQEVRDIIQQVRQSQQDVADMLAPIADSLNNNGKETLLRAAYQVAQADGEMPAEERNLIARVGASLGMTAAHIKGVISASEEDE